MDEKPTFERLSDEERRKWFDELYHGLCVCGHKRSEHSKFINGLFVGCQHKDCECQKFEWPKEKEIK